MRALVDTGAPIPLFDRGVADALGIRLGKASAEVGSSFSRQLGVTPTTGGRALPLPHSVWRATWAFRRLVVQPPPCKLGWSTSN